MADPSLPSLFPVQEQDPDLPSIDPVGVGSSDTLLKDVKEGKKFKIQPGQAGMNLLPKSDPTYFMSANKDGAFFFHHIKNGQLVNPQKDLPLIPGYMFYGTHPYATLKVEELSDEPQSMPGGKRKRKTKKVKKSKKSKKTKRRY